ncbi:MAG: winged helix-turn-helix transcriptional regulator [Myxococcota bacterium]
MRFKDLIDEPCTISRPLGVLGDRWTLVVVKQAFAGTRRFEDFLAALRISRSRLADRLERLVADGILRKEPYADTRTRHEYRLTQKGLDLYPVLQAIRAWGDRYMAPEGAPLRYRHRACGGEPRVRLVCSECEAELSAHDVRVELGPGFPTGA